MIQGQIDPIGRFAQFLVRFRGIFHRGILLQGRGLGLRVEYQLGRIVEVEEELVVEGEVVGIGGIEVEESLGFGVGT